MLGSLSVASVVDSVVVFTSVVVVGSTVTTSEETSVVGSGTTGTTGTFGYGVTTGAGVGTTGVGAGITTGVGVGFNGCGIGGGSLTFGTPNLTLNFHVLQMLEYMLIPSFASTK